MCHEPQLQTMMNQDSELSLEQAEGLLVNAIRERGTQSWAEQKALVEVFQMLDQVHEAATDSKLFTADTKLVDSYPKMLKAKTATFWAKWFEPFITYRQSIWVQASATPQSA